MTTSFSLIEHLAARAAGEQVVYRPQPGHAGDALISLATFALFERAGLRYRIARQDEDLAGRVVICAGGGNFVEHYDDCARFVRRQHDRVRHLVILPQTVSGNEELLSRLGSNVDIVCRERVSLAHVQRSAPRANALLADDLALELDSVAILEGRLTGLGARTEPVDGSVRRGGLRYRRKRLPSELSRAVQSLAGRTRVLHCIRRDAERGPQPIPYDNVDLPRFIRHDTLNCSLYHCSRASHELFRVLNRFDEIRTNRLHVAIASSLLGKRVLLGAGSYFKNEAVYEHSLRGRFPNVEWMAG